MGKREDKMYTIFFESFEEGKEGEGTFEEPRLRENSTFHAYQKKDRQIYINRLIRTTWFLDFVHRPEF
jgi:hypothetical protein